MKIYIEIFLVILILFLLATPTVSFKPFNITFKQPLISFAVLFLVIAIVFFRIHFEKKGYEKGIEDTVKVISEIQKKEIQTKENK